MEKSKFWDDQLKKALVKHKDNPKKYWELCSIIVFKYKLKTKTRGYSASMIAYKLLEDAGEKLTKEEREFLGEVLSG